MSRHETWFKKLGQEPRCFGRYTEGDPKCDGGLKLCSHLMPCRKWTDLVDHLDANKTTPGEFREALTPDGFARVLYNLSRRDEKPASPSEARAREGWEAFLAAFLSVVPASMRIPTTSSLARPGDLVVDATKDDKSRTRKVSLWSIYERQTSGFFWVCSYDPRPFTRSTPTIEFRISHERLPTFVLPYAEQWVSRNNHTVAKRVDPVYVEPLGRLVGRAWANNQLGDQMNEGDALWTSGT